MPGPKAVAAPHATLPHAASSPAAAAPAPDTAVLRHGELVLDGRLVDSSNTALVGSVTWGGVTERCVYKPVRGERPLWDFPDGTLAHREVAAALVARAAGWDCVPATVFRRGPLGLGMVQRWIAAADPSRVVDLVPAEAIPEGWLHVLAVRDEQGREFALAHADSDALATIAVFDLVTNNADRKGSHLLATADGAIRGVDHGLTFHPEPKLRTILWGWAGRPLPNPVIPALAALAEALDGPLRAALNDHLTAAEITATADRLAALIADPRFPMPPQERTAIPWPPL